MKKEEIFVSDDGYLLSKLFHKKCLQRKIDWQSMNITEKELREQGNLSCNFDEKWNKVDKRVRPNSDNQDEMDRFYVMDLSLPYNPPPDDRDQFFYYSDIGALCGSAGYVRIRDGYIWGYRAIVRS